MKAMILAAGKGTRVRPITNSIPKPMIPIIRKPVIQYIVEHLKSYGVKDIIINTSHLASKIENYLRDGDQLGVNIAYSYEGFKCGKVLKSTALGSAGGMKKIQEFSGFFDETFIVLCGDAWIDLDLEKALKFHRENGAIATVILQRVPHDEVYKYGVVNLDETGKVLSFQEKPSPDEALSNLVNTGIYIFEPEVFDSIPVEGEFDIGGDLLPNLVEMGAAFYGHEDDFQWVDIGSVPDIFNSTRLALNENIDGLVPPGREIQKGVWVGEHIKLDFNKVDIVPPVYIGSGSCIEDGARIEGPSVIGSGCLIESGAVLKEAIIDDYTRVSGAATIERKLLLESCCVDSTGRSIDLDDAKLDWLIDDARVLGRGDSNYGSLISDMATRVDM